MITLSEFRKLPNEIFRSGICSNSETGVFMTRNSIEHLRFVARKWSNDSWSVYIGTVDMPQSKIERQGDFISNIDIIKRIIPVDEDVLQLYQNE